MQTNTSIIDTATIQVVNEISIPIQISHDAFEKKVELLFKDRHTFEKQLEFLKETVLDPELFLAASGVFDGRLNLLSLVEGIQRGDLSQTIGIVRDRIERTKLFCANMADRASERKRKHDELKSTIPSRSQLEMMTVEELKQVAREIGMAWRGRKQAMIERILEY